jgi:hypothetical protein
MFTSADSNRRIPVYGNRAYYAMTGRYLLMFGALIVMERYFAMFAIRYRYVVHDFKQRHNCCRKTYGRIYRDSELFLPSRSHLVMITCLKTKRLLTLYCTYWRIFKALTRLIELLPVMCILSVGSCLYWCVLMWQRPCICVAQMHI